MGVKDFLEQNHSLLSDSPAQLNDNFWLTKYLFLEYFVEFCTNSYTIDNEEVITLLGNGKIILEYLSPLKVSLLESSTFEKII